MEKKNAERASEVMRLDGLERRVEDLHVTIQTRASASSQAAERLSKIENQVRDLEQTVRPGESPAIGVFFLIALIAFVALIAKLPLPNSPDVPSRVAIGIASLVGGVVTFGVAAALVSLTFKALVEFATVCLLSVNVAIGAVAWSFSPQLKELASNVRDLLVENELVEPGFPDEIPFGFILLAIAICMLLIDALVLLVLLPAAKIAGTKL